MKRCWLANAIYIWGSHVWLAKSDFFQVGFNYGDYLDYFTTRDAKDCQVYIYLEFRLISFSFRKDLIKITYTILSFWKLLDSGWSFIPRPPSTHLKNQNMAWWFTQQSKEDGQKLLWESGPCLRHSPEKKMLYFGHCLNFLFPQPPPPNLGNLYNFFSDVRIQDLKVSLGLKVLYILYLYNLKDSSKLKLLALEEVDSFFTKNAPLENVPKNLDRAFPPPPHSGNAQKMPKRMHIFLRRMSLRRVHPFMEKK